MVGAGGSFGVAVVFEVVEVDYLAFDAFEPFSVAFDAVEPAVLVDPVDTGCEGTIDDSEVFDVGFIGDEIEFVFAVECFIDVPDFHGDLHLDPVFDGYLVGDLAGFGTFDFDQTGFAVYNLDTIWGSTDVGEGGVNAQT